MQVETAPKHGHAIAVALAGLFAVSACSTLGEVELAVVPGTPSADRDTTAAADRSTPAPRPTPSPTPRPRPRKVAERTSEPRGNTGSQAGGAQAVVSLKPRPKAGPFEINLYRKGDFMHQATKDWCVAGSAQTMMNIIDDGKPNRSVTFQERLYEEGRRLSNNQAKLTAIGVDLTGWANLLNTHGYGPYVVEASDTRRGAIHKAARALRETGRPVGLVTWRGAHSWVMSGFTATADPAYQRSFTVKKVYIQDTWYPSVSSIWGASRPPDALVPLTALAEDYLPYRRPAHRWPKRDGKFMLILPVLPEGAIAR